MDNHQNSNSQSNLSSLFREDPGKMADSTYEQNLRRSIISIHNDSSLAPAQKAQMIQVNYNCNYTN